MAIDRNNKIQILYSETASQKPDVTQLEPGELAINTADAIMYFKKEDGSTGSIESDQIITTIYFNNDFNGGTNFSISPESKGITFIAGDGARFDQTSDPDTVQVTSTLSFAGGNQPNHPLTFYYDNRWGIYPQDISNDVDNDTATDHGVGSDDFDDQPPGWMTFTTREPSSGDHLDYGGPTFSEGILVSFSNENIFGDLIRNYVDSLPLEYRNPVCGQSEGPNTFYEITDAYPTISDLNKESIQFTIKRVSDNSYVRVKHRNTSSDAYCSGDIYDYSPHYCKAYRINQTNVPVDSCLQSFVCFAGTPSLTQEHNTFILGTAVNSNLVLDAQDEYDFGPGYFCDLNGTPFDYNDWSEITTAGVDYHDWSYGDTLEVYIELVDNFSGKQSRNTNESLFVETRGLYGITTNSSPGSGECFFNASLLQAVTLKGPTGAITTNIPSFSIHKNDIRGNNHELLNLAFETRNAGDFIFVDAGTYVRGFTGYTAGTMIFKTSGFTTSGDYYTFTVDETIIQNDGLSGGDLATVYFRPSSETRIGGTGESGPAGATGATGATGPGVGYTSGADTPSSANTGDFWLETDTGDLFFYDGSSFVQISGADGATGATGPQGDQGIQGNTGATGPVGDYVESINGATGAIEKIYGCFYNGTGVTFSTAQTTIPLDTVMYNSDPAGLTLSSNRIQINKAGTFKITADLAVGLTGSVAPGSLLVVESQMFKKSGILSPTAVNGTKMYHTIERQDPDASTTVTTEFTVPANASCTMITNGHVSGNSYLLQCIKYWDSGTGLNGNYFSVPAECYRITVEEL